VHSGWRLNALPKSLVSGKVYTGLGKLGLAVFVWNQRTVQMEYTPLYLPVVEAPRQLEEVELRSLVVEEGIVAAVQEHKRCTGLVVVDLWVAL